MTADVVLIISQLQEPSTDIVSRHLSERGHRVLRLNSEEFALSVCVGAEVSERSSRFFLGFEDSQVSSDEICSVWHRRWTYPVYPSSLDEASISFCFSETTGLLGGLPSLTSIRWINDIHAERRASNKLVQLRTAKALGFRIPKTLVTNDPKAVREFISGHGEKVIFKPVSGSSILYRSYADETIAAIRKKYDEYDIDQGMPPPNQVLYTRQLTKPRLDQIQSLRWAPVIFQEMIEKTADVRVTVVGKDIFSCLIHSQEQPETMIDFRVMNTGIDLKHEITTLPDRTVDFIHRLMSELGLEFGCIDFVIDRHTGDYVFLEINPAGQWLWVEAKTGLRISEALAARLSQKDR